MTHTFFHPRFASRARRGFIPALACLALGGALHPAAASPPITFTEPSAIPTMPTTNMYRSFLGVAQGDFNGDGKLDVAALFSDNDTYNGFGLIQITLGNGDGTFQTPTVIKIPQTATGGEIDGNCILAKDFNGDGKLDLAVTTTNQTVLIFMGKGDGTFQTPVSYALPANANDLEAGDVNGDGKLDLVVLFNSIKEVGVMPGNGDGTFELPATYAVEAGASDMALADVDNKHGLDIVVATYDAHSIDCLLNNGNGTFAAYRSTSVGNDSFNGMYVADFDGDGKVDVVGGGTGGVSSAAGYHSDNLVFLKGVGDGTFLAPSASNDFPSAGNFSQRVLSENVAPDLNGDGHPDVVFTCGSENLLTIGYGDGHGGFTLQYCTAIGSTGVPGTVIGGADPISLVFGNFTSQAHPDIVVSGASANGGPGGLSLLRANPAKPGAFLTSYAYSTGDPVYGKGNVTDTSSFALGDFLHNGKVSLAALGSEGNTNGVIVLPGLGDGTFASLLPDFGSVPNLFSGANEPGNGGFVNGLQAADFNGDGISDLIFNTTGGVQGSDTPYQIWSFGTGNGTFGNGGGVLTGNGGAPTPSEIADFNRDGHPDFAAYINEGGGGLGSIAPVHIRVYDYGVSGANTFGLTQDIDTGTTNDVHGFAAGDFDGDGKPDLLAHSVNPDRLTFYKGNGNGTFQTQSPVQTSPGVSYFFSTATADLNGDGHLDLIIGTYSGIQVLLGNGDGTFGQPTTYAVPGTEDISGIAVADFNGDRRLDIAVAGADDAVILPGNGDGTFGAPLSFATGFHGPTLAVHFADLNGDGRPDLVVAGNENGNNVRYTVLLNADGKLSDKHLLWDNTNGQAALWNVFADGSFTSSIFGPFAGWKAIAVSGNPDSTSHMLWTNTNGEASLYTVNIGETSPTPNTAPTPATPPSRSRKAPTAKPASCGTTPAASPPCGLSVSAAR